jgi:hypothetical protein
LLCDKNNPIESVKQTQGLSSIKPEDVIPLEAKLLGVHVHCDKALNDKDRLI